MLGQSTSIGLQCHLACHDDVDIFVKTALSVDALVVDEVDPLEMFVERCQLSQRPFAKERYLVQHFDPCQIGLSETLSYSSHEWFPWQEKNNSFLDRNEGGSSSKVMLPI